MKCFGYIRCSGPSQLNGDGPERQKQAIEAFAKTHGLDIVRWFVESHTGTDLEGRPEFQAMRAELFRDGVKLVAIERMDRLARDVMIQETIIADFRKHGIDLKSATPGEEDLCSEEPTRQLVRQILGAIAGYDRAMTVMKLNAGRARKRAMGGHAEGRLKYGEHPAHPEEIGLVNQIRKAHLAYGSNASQIARELNEEGIKTRCGTNWSPTQVARILRRSV